jgi:hypothetical protein
MESSMIDNEYVVKTACWPCAYKVEPRNNATCNFFRTASEAWAEVDRLKSIRKTVTQVKVDLHDTK